VRRAVPFQTRDGRHGFVRPARRTDARACLRILAEAAAERPRTLAILEREIWPPRVWRRHRLDWSAHGVTLVAVLDGAVAGQLGCERRRHPATRHVAAFGITIARAARGIGIGRALLQAMELWAVEFGVARLELGVFEHNARARGLYRSLGYQDEGIDRCGARFPEGDVDVVRMAKLVGPSIGDDPSTTIVHADAGPSTEGVEHAAVPRHGSTETNGGR
jgi:putative acetyltransferase